MKQHCHSLSAVVSQNISRETMYKILPIKSTMVTLNWVQSDQLGETFQSRQSHPFLEAYTNCICKLPKIMSLHPL